MSLSCAQSAPMNAPIETPPILSIGMPASSTACNSHSSELQLTGKVKTSFCGTRAELFRPNPNYPRFDFFITALNKAVEANEEHIFSRES